MANNRIYLRCKQCGDVLYLGKTFGSDYHYNNYSEENLENKLNAFYSEHSYCMDDLKQNIFEPILDESKDRYSYDNQYDICYEFYEEEK